jgi:hypothetical protein
MLFPEKLKTKRSSPLNPNSSNPSASSPPDYTAVPSASTPASPSPLQQELEPAGTFTVQPSPNCTKVHTVISSKRLISNPCF